MSAHRFKGSLEELRATVYNHHVKEIVPKLCQRLKETGFNIEPGQIATAAQ